MSDLKELKNKACNLKALIVEDSLTIQKQMKIFLEKLFKEVQIANNGVEALEKVDEFKPDIILTDLQMPKMDGHEFITRLKSSNNSAKIIVFSAYGHSENVIKFLRLGVSDFIQKPVNFNQLTETLKKTIDQNSNENIVKDFSDKILKELNFIKISNSPVELINNFKGIPIIHSGQITYVEENEIRIKTQSIQKKVIQVQKKCLIKTENVYANAILKSYDESNDELIFEKPKQIDSSFKSRETLRVEPDDSFKVVTYTSKDRFNFECKKVSSKVLEFEIKFLNSDIKVKESVNMIIAFDLAYKSAYHTGVTHKERIDCKGEIMHIEPLGDNLSKLLVSIDLRSSDKSVLEKYVYQREIEILTEFKNLVI